jgi:DNA-binding CsgD family transcriptional regulator
VYLSPEGQARLIELNARGLTIKEIAKIVNATPGVVYHALRRSPDYVPSRHGKAARVTKDEALKLHKEGLTLREIGERMGLNAATVRSRIKDDPDYIPHRRSRTLGMGRGFSRIPQEKIARLPDMVAQGWTKSQIAAYLGCSRQYVDLMLKKPPHNSRAKVLKAPRNEVA